MSCSLENNFTRIYGKEMENGTEIPEENIMSVSSWIAQNSAMMEEYGFKEKVVTIDYKDGKAVLNYNRENAIKWDYHKRAIDSQDAVFNADIREVESSIRPYNSATFRPANASNFINETDNSSPPTAESALNFTAPTQEFNFTDWRNNRTALKFRLEALKKRYRNDISEQIKLKEVNKVLAEVNQQLKDYRDDNIEIIHEIVLNEIDNLKVTLANINANPDTASGLLEASLLDERINSLSLYFNNVDLKTGKPGGNTSLKEMSENHFGEEQYSKLSRKIIDLGESYNKSLYNIIESTFMNNPLVKEHQNSINSAITPEEKQIAKENFERFYNKALEVLKSNTVYLGEVSPLAADTIGASLVDSVLADMLNAAKDSYYQAEVGDTIRDEEAFNKAWEKIKDEKVDVTDDEGNTKKEFLTTLLFKKNKLGLRSPNRLIGFYKHLKFSETKQSIGKLKFLFQVKKSDVEKAKTYKALLKGMKEKVDFIQPHKLKYFYDKYKDNDLFNIYFEDYNEAEAITYEKEMKSGILGEALYGIEVENLDKKIEQYLKEVDNNTFADMDTEVFSKNPVAFIKHFYSPNYAEKDILTGTYLDFDFATYIPRMSSDDYYDARDFYDEKTRELNERYGKDFSDVVVYANKLWAGYINPSLKDSGENVFLNEVMNVADYLDREIIADLKARGEYLGIAKRYWKHIWNKFSGGFKTSYIEETSDKKDFKDFQQTNISTRYSSYGKNRRVNLYHTFKGMSKEQLIKELARQGHTVSDIKAVRLTENELMNGLIDLILSKATSSNLHTSTIDALKITRSLNSRKRAESLYKVMKDFMTKSKDMENNKELNWLEDWAELNVYGRKRTKNNADPGGFFKTGLKVKVNSELDNYLEGVVGKENMKRDKEYQDQMVNIYSSAAGLAKGLYGTYMRTISPARYFKNRIPGMNQNMTFAATREYGFGMKEFTIARQFNSNSITQKLFHWQKIRKFFGAEETEKEKTRQSLVMLATKTNFFESLVDELKSEGEFKSSGIFSGINTALNNVATNYPEYKNQMELLMMILQVHKVPTINKDANGDTIYKPIFDGKNTIWIPGTLELRDEFKTEDNILNWEKFEANTQGYSPQNLVLAKAKQAKKIGHGNLSKDDIVPLKGSEVGKLIAIFKSWFFGNTYKQYGSKQIDLTTGRVDIKGYKNLLAEHAPTFLAHITMMNVGLGTTGGVIAAFVGAGTILTTTAVVIPAATLTYIIFKHHKKMRQTLFTPSEVMLSGNYLLEALYRTINIVPNYVKLHGPIKEDKIRSMRFTPEGMSAQERDIISGSAQEVAQRMSLVIASAIFTTVMSGIVALLKSYYDGDDEEKVKETMKDVEKVLNVFVNVKQTLAEDSERSTNPFMLGETASANILYQSTKRNLTSFAKAFQDLEKSKIGGGEFAIKVTKSASPFIGVPKAFTEILEPTSLFQEERVYSQRDWFDRKLQEMVRTPEENYKMSVDKRREPLLNDAKNAVRSKYPDINEDEVTERAKDLIDRVYKDNWSSYESLNDADDVWEEVEDDIEKYEDEE